MRTQPLPVSLPQNPESHSLPLLSTAPWHPSPGFHWSPERLFPTPVLYPISHPAPALHPLVSCGCPDLNVSPIILKTQLFSCTSHMSHAPHPHVASGCCQGRYRRRPQDKFCWTATQLRAGDEQEQKQLHRLSVIHPALFHLSFNVHCYHRNRVGKYE